MTPSRPNPDALLAQVQAEEATAARGKLKIFFGFAPGVGKTYAMLEAARKEAKEGVDVVLGYVEPHVRPETQALTLGLDLLARKKIDYLGKSLTEFDLEAALERKPRLLVLDELAHTNAPGCTHAKRWQDVQQLLHAGVDVYTTLNVQHLESLNDIVAQVLGVQVRETVPDQVFETAEEVELVDLAPDDLVARLQEGKVYIAPQANLAVHNFFRKGNLIALRELALRRMADRVNAQMETYRQTHAVDAVWPISDRLLVCVGPGPFAARLIRATCRMAATFKAPWLAVHVETPAAANLSPVDRARLNAHLHLAEQLGGETVSLTGTNVVDEVIAYARQRNVTKIIAGKPQQARWREWLFGSFIYELTRRCGDIDVYVISGEPADHPEALRRPIPAPRRPATYLKGSAVVAAATGLSLLLYPWVATVNLVMLYLIGVVATALWLGRGPSVLASVLSVAAYDFCFVPPRWTFAVADTEYLFTFFVMLGTGLIISHLTSVVRLQVLAARQRERHTAALFSLSRELAAVEDLQEIIQVITRLTAAALNAQVALLLPREHEGLAPQNSSDHGFVVTARDLAVASWVMNNKQRAGLGTATLGGAEALYLPLEVSQKIVGVLGVRPQDPTLFQNPEPLRLAEALAGQAAAGLDRAQLAAQAEQVRLQVEAERMRNSLLSAVSHDLRTPLASIAGASSTLLDNGAAVDDVTRRDLLQTIFAEAERLNHLVGNLLEATRLEAGGLTPHRDWQSLEEIIGAVLRRLTSLLQRHPVTVRLPQDLPLVFADGVLLQEVFANLLDNARKYAPPDTAIDISAQRLGATLQVDVADRGPGLPPGQESRVFEKFYRGDSSQPRSGVGLGLPICKGIVELHGGAMTALPRAGGGAIFRFTLPLEGEPPMMDVELPPAL